MPEVITETEPTLLRITGIGIAPYSARGLTQTLTPISAQSHMRRTVNGVLKDLSKEQFRKFKSTISGNDLQSPPFSGIWSGMPVTVECVAQLAYVAGSAERPAVSGSTYTDGGASYFRPILEMLVVSWSIQEDEYGRAVSWSLDLEEI